MRARVSDRTRRGNHSKDHHMFAKMDWHTFIMTAWIAAVFLHALFAR